MFLFCFLQLETNVKAVNDKLKLTPTDSANMVSSVTLAVRQTNSVKGVRKVSELCMHRTIGSFYTVLLMVLGVNHALPEDWYTTQNAEIVKLSGLVSNVLMLVRTLKNFHKFFNGKFFFDSFAFSFSLVLIPRLLVITKSGA